MDRRHDTAGKPPVEVSRTTPNGEEPPKVTGDEALIVAAYFSGAKLREQVGVTGDLPEPEAAIAIGEHLEPGTGAHLAAVLAASECALSESSVLISGMADQVLASQKLVSGDPEVYGQIRIAFLQGLYRSIYRGKLHYIFPASTEHPEFGPMLLFTTKHPAIRQILKEVFGSEEMPTMAEAEAVLGDESKQTMLRELPLPEPLVGIWGGWRWFFYPVAPKRGEEVKP